MKKRILVAHDESSFCQFIKSHLEQSGLYEVRIVEWEGGLLSAIQEFKPELIMLQGQMAYMFGDKYPMAKFHNDDVLREIRIIILDACCMKDRPSNYYENFTGYPIIIASPKIQEIMKRIEEVLNAPWPNSTLEAYRMGWGLSIKLFAQGLKRFWFG